MEIQVKYLSVFQGRAPDLKYIESAARMIANVSTSTKIVVEKSTVPVKAAESIQNILKANQKSGVKYQVSLARQLRASRIFSRLTRNLASNIR